MRTLSLYLKWIIMVSIFGTLMVISKQILNLHLFKANVEKQLFYDISLPNDIGFYHYLLMEIFVCFSLLYLIYHLNTFRKVTNDFSEDLIFSKKNSKELRSVGLGLLSFTAVAGIFKVVTSCYYFFKTSPAFLSSDNPDISYNTGYAIGYSISQIIYFMPILIIAFLVLLIVELIKNG